MKNSDLLLLAAAGAAIYALTRPAKANNVAPFPKPLLTSPGAPGTGLVIDAAEWGNYEVGFNDVLDELSLMIDAEGHIDVTPTTYDFGGSIADENFLRVWYHLADGRQQYREIHEYVQDFLP